MTESKKFESGKTYVPIMAVPLQKDRRDKMFYDFLSGLESETCGGMNALGYVLSELTGNIYEHSRFSQAFIAAQSYPTLQFTEVTIIDNGISIPNSYEIKNISFENDCDALSKALEGVSTKGPERGIGLSSSLNLLRKGLNSSCLMVTRGAILYTDKENIIISALEEFDKFSGTLISARIPYTTEQVNIYDYID